MNINLQSFTDSTLAAYRVVAEQLGRLGEHTVKVLNWASQRVQDSRIAIPVVVAANIVFFEVITLTMRGIAAIFDPQKIYQTLPDKQKQVRALLIFSALSASMAAADVLLYRSLKIPLSPLVMTAISISTCMAYVFVKSGFMTRY